MNVGYCVSILLVIVSSVRKSNATDDISVHTLGHPTFRTRTADAIIMNAVDEIRNFMVTGLPGVLPVLDPYKTALVTYSENITPRDKITLDISELKLTRLSTFEIEELEVETINPIRLTYAVRMLLEAPVVLLFLNDFDLELAAFSLNISRTDDIEVKILEPKLDLDLHIKLILGKDTLHLKIIECKAFINIGDIEPTVIGLYNDVVYSDFIAVVKYTLFEILDTYSDAVSETISPIIMNTGNQILANINLIDSYRML